MSGNSLSWLVRGITLLIALLILQVQGSGPQLSTTGLAVILLALGIPHGAADHLVFRSTRPGRRDVYQLRFTAYYFVLIAAYCLLWYLLPAAAFVLFIGMSIYHFGQSYEGRAVSDPVIWGAFVLLFPVLLHYDQAEPIISQMIGRSVPLSFSFTTTACILLVATNVLVPTLYWRAGELSRRELGYRWLDVVLLAFLYLATDLLLGFAVYFLLWHSLPAARSQWVYLSNRQLSGGLSSYARQLLPLTLGAFVSLSLVYVYLVVFSGRTLDMGLLFILISLITLPHAFLVDRVYRR